MYWTFGIVIASLVCLGEAWGRDNSKTFKSLPAISNSLVNFGKMDISFHFNSKTPDLLSASNIKSEYSHSPSPYIVNKQEQIDIEPCTCSNLKNFKNPFLSSSTDVLNKILKSNDLFSFNQDQTVSTMCCESHGNTQEDTMFFDFSPKITSESPSIQSIQPMVENFLPKTFMSSGSSKPKAIEIFFFPKKKESVNSFFEFPKLWPGKKDISKKTEIQVVGDKEIKNDIKSLKYRPSYYTETKKEKVKKKDNQIVPKERQEVEDTTIVESVNSFFEFPKVWPGKKDISKKTEIQVVGDKDIKNDFKSLKYRPSYYTKTKKEKVQEKDKQIVPTERQEVEDTTIVETSTLGSSNAL